MKRLLFSLLFLPSLGFCGTFTLGGSGTGSLVILATNTATSTLIYPATATPSFPFGLSASTMTVSSNTVIPGATFYASAPILVSTYIAFSPTTMGIKGTTTSDNADKGTYGEFVSSLILTSSNFAASTVAADYGAVPLTAGDWDISWCIRVQRNGASVTRYLIGLNNIAGNDQSNVSPGDNAIDEQGTATVADTVTTYCVPSYRLSTASNVTWYLTVRGDYSVATPLVTGARISARRIR